MIKWFFWLAMVAMGIYGGYKWGQNSTKAQALMESRLEKIARAQVEKMRQKAYVLVHRNKLDLYFASSDKVEGYMKSHYRQIERVWTCQR